MNYELIRQISKSKGISLEKIANELGVTYQYVYKLLTDGSNIRVKTLEEISKVLNVHISIFFDDFPQPEKSKIEQLEERLAAIEEKLNQR